MLASGRTQSAPKANLIRLTGGAMTVAGAKPIFGEPCAIE